MDQETGVTQDASPAPEVQTTEVSAASAPVSAAPVDRPIENLKGEFDRKFNKVQQTLDAVMSVLALQQQQSQQSQTPKKEATMDELYQLATQGDRGALDEYNRRIAAQEYDRKNAAQTRTQTMQSQLQVLMSKYPVFNDTSHPLTQTFQQAYQLLVRAGYPKDESTVVDAMKTALAERPDLVADLYTQTARAQEQQRRSATSVSQSGQTTASHRNSPPPASKNKPTPEQIAQSQRMGVKDPEGVMKRFYERQQKGQSSVSPMLKMVLEAEEGA